MSAPLTSAAIAPFAHDWVAEQTSHYLGEWVAVCDGRVIASGDSMDEAFAAADQLGMGDALVFKVPAQPGRPVLL